MSAYTPEFTYGAIHDENGHWTGKQGLVPWPAHLAPRRREMAQERPDIELTKKGEAHVAAALREANGVFFLMLDRNDREAIATTIERLIGMLDDMDGDCDLEPWLGTAFGDDREGDSSDDEPEESDMDSDDEPSLGWNERGDFGWMSPFCVDLEDEETDQNGDEGDYSRSEDDAMAKELYCLAFHTFPGGQGL